MIPKLSPRALYKGNHSDIVCGSSCVTIGFSLQIILLIQLSTRIHEQCVSIQNKLTTFSRRNFH